MSVSSGMKNLIALHWDGDTARLHEMYIIYNKEVSITVWLLYLLHSSTQASWYYVCPLHAVPKDPTSRTDGATLHYLETCPGGKSELTIWLQFWAMIHYIVISKLYKFGAWHVFNFSLLPNPNVLSIFYTLCQATFSPFAFEYSIVCFPSFFVIKHIFLQIYGKMQRITKKTWNEVSYRS